MGTGNHTTIIALALGFAILVAARAIIGALT